MTPLAQNDRVQWIEPYIKRSLVNDLTNLKLGTSTNNGLNTQYLELTGKNIRVNVNDTGVDQTHPDLAGRIVDGDPFAYDDLDGHGTHVAGIIASSGKSAPPGSGLGTPPGSANNATFQGKAPEALIVPFLIDPLLGPFQGDSSLQEAAATNGVFISNNSWGYLGVPDYDISAASFDAAVRDSSRFLSGQQSIAYVFAAGNSGDGSAEGTDGIAGSISSPATAKNVITVGALESLRRIQSGPVSTNSVGESETNTFFYADTDSDKQIADYSSRGNVGVTQEGDFGRFKPDVVAPGTFIISTRASNWKDPRFIPEYVPLFQRGQTIEALATNYYTLTVPDNTALISLRVVPNSASPVPFPGLLVGLKQGSLPPPADASGTNYLRLATTSGGFYYLSVQNPTKSQVAFDLFAALTLTNAPVDSDYLTELKNLNDQLPPTYRYESGTSMAAPAVSGMLALMYDFFVNHVGTNIPPPTPALAKALLINSAQTVDDQYSFKVNTSLNLQGWGRPEMARIIPGIMYSNIGSPSSWPVQFFDQGVGRLGPNPPGKSAALATGESETRIIRFDPTNSPASIQSGMKVTLVWTDPPGNPGVGIKLVNDLDLIVTNLSSPTHEVYIGNMIKGDAIFNQPVEVGADPELDIINNVENVILEGPLDASYSVTVRATRVNVNAVSAFPTEILQDYALVISVGDLTITNAFKIEDPSASNLPFVQSGPATITLTNKSPLISERAGAQSPVVAGTNGTLSQWRFYEFVPTNRYTAVSTVSKGNLSRPRLDVADIDLYVSTDPGLLYLDTAVLEKCIQQGAVSADFENGCSRTRNAKELVVINNTLINTTYYVAVKSEDQQAGEYIIQFVSQDKPFDAANGECQEVSFVSTPTLIPDGANLTPQGVNVFMPAVFTAVGSKTTLIENTRVTIKFRHESPGDVTALLVSPSGSIVTLFSHSLSSLAPGDLHTLVFDDIPNSNIPGVLRTEGPLHMDAWVDTDAVGLWQLAIYDEAPFYSGVVEEATLCIVPKESCDIAYNPDGCEFTLPPFGSKFYAFDVPTDATKVELCILANPLPVELYLRKGLIWPTFNDWDYFEAIPPASTLTPPEIETCMVLDGFSSPPLSPGPYRLRIYNNNSIENKGIFVLKISRGLLSDSYLTYVANPGPAGLPITDDAVTWSALNVDTNRLIVDARVGVRLDHSRASDLAIRLVSPRGTSWLLSENRGNSQAVGFGGTFGVNGFQGSEDQILTNYSWITFTDSTNTTGAMMKFVPVDSVIPPFRSPATHPLPEIVDFNFDALPPSVYTMGSTIPDIWQVIANTVAITNDSGLSGIHTNYLALSGGAISTRMDVRSERQYRLEFAYRKVSSSQTQEVQFPVGFTRATVPDLDPITGVISPGVIAPKLRVSPGQVVHLTVSPTNKISVDGSSNTFTAQGDPNTPGPFAPYPAYSLIGQWAYSATLLSTQMNWKEPFFVGTNLVIQAPSDPGDYYLWLSINDPTFKDNPSTPSEFQVTARWQPSQLASFNYVLNGITNTLFAADYWQTNRVRFIGRTDDPRLTFLAHWNDTVLIDAVKVVEPIATEFYLAEEAIPHTRKAEASSPGAPLVSLPALFGENTEGVWHLELNDSRVGQNDLLGVPGVLWSWYLQLLFAPGQQAIPLTNSIPAFGLLRRNQIFYYVVNVPKEAVTINNRLLGNNLQLFFNRNGFPDPAVDFVSDPLVLKVGNGPGDDVAPGSRYFLAVKNNNPNILSNRFGVRVDFELPMITLVDGPGNICGDPVRVATETNVLTAVPGLGAFTNILYPGTNMHWYQHRIAALPRPHSVVYELISTNKELHMVVKRGLADADYLPTPTVYDYHSINYHPTNEFVVVRTNSFPIGLTPIPWLIGVYNSGTNVSAYTIVATTWDKAPPPDCREKPGGYGVDTNCFNLTNEFHFTLAPGDYLNYFYCFNTSITNSAVLVELLDITGDVDLFVRRDDLPSPYLYDFSDLQTGIQTEHITLRTNIFLSTFGTRTNMPIVARGTNWYFQLVNQSSNAVAEGNVKLTTASGNIPLVSGLPLSLEPVGSSTSGGGLTIRWRSLPGERYEIRSATAVGGPFDNRLATVTATSSHSEYTAPPAAASRFYRVIQLGP